MYTWKNLCFILVNTHVILKEKRDNKRNFTPCNFYSYVSLSFLASFGKNLSADCRRPLSFSETCLTPHQLCKHQKCKICTFSVAIKGQISVIIGYRYLGILVLVSLYILGDTKISKTCINKEIGKARISEFCNHTINTLQLHFI